MQKFALKKENWELSHETKPGRILETKLHKNSLYQNKKNHYCPIKKQSNEKNNILQYDSGNTDWSRECGTYIVQQG